MCSINTFSADIRPLEALELPWKILLLYGSSILHGSSTSFHSAAYSVCAGYLPSYDVLVKGMGGSCRCKEEFNQIICNTAKQAQSPDVWLIEGENVLTSTPLLSTDEIHPSTEGHFRMGQNSYEQICCFNK